MSFNDLVNIVSTVYKHTNSVKSTAFTDEGTLPKEINGHTYHVISVLTDDDYMPILDWLKQQPQDWYSLLHMPKVGRILVFINEQLYTMFMLRWA